MTRKHYSTANFRRYKRLINQRRRLGFFYLERLNEYQLEKPFVVVLTGAGISVESGIKTFRASDGLWEEHRVEDVATPEGYARDPELVLRFYNERRRQLIQPETQPNDAHLALAELERYLGNRFLLITQNIDNLHEEAGNHHIIHMHGELFKVRCVHSGNVFTWKRDMTQEQSCFCCQRTGTLRPHIVWFGEQPLEMETIYQALEQADYFISIGTSGHVYPAAGFVEYAKQHGAHTVELNLEPSKVESRFDEKHYGPATQIVPEYIRYCLNECKKKAEKEQKSCW